MRHRRNAAAQSGYTLIELMVVVAIIGIMATIAGSYFLRTTSRGNLASSASELQALFHQARQTALATGNPVAVLVYPNYSPPSGGGATAKGYFIVYQDACFDFFTGGATCGVSYSAYAPATLKYGGTSQVIDTMTLPHGVVVGPSTGMGAAATLRAPLQGVVVNVACSFCGTTGGAVQFDSRGQATFFKLSGTTVTPYTPSGGASLSLGYDSAVTDATGQDTFVILSGSGAVEVLKGG